MPACAAWALIPDDDDEDLVEKAKAKRSQKLKEELGTQKKFARRQVALPSLCPEHAYASAKVHWELWHPSVGRVQRRTVAATITATFSATTQRMTAATDCWHH